MKTQLTFIHALTPLHAGIGQGSGVIDLPIAREKATNMPFLPGSSLKGALRSRCSDLDGGKKDKDCGIIFGPDNPQSDAEHRASSVVFSDQRLLFLPVRSLAGTFAWVTSPFVLNRLFRDMQHAQTQNTANLLKMPLTIDEAGCILPVSSSVLQLPFKEKTDTTEKIVVCLEDIDLTSTIQHDLKNFVNTLATFIFPEDETWQKEFLNRFCLVSDNVFNFLSENGTEVTARIKLKEESKIVTKGGLWYEEALPAESILSGVMMITPTQDAQKAGFDEQKISNTLSKISNTPLQLGGKATVGRGMCQVRFV